MTCPNCNTAFAMRRIKYGTDKCIEMHVCECEQAKIEARHSKPKPEAHDGKANACGRD